MRIARWALLCAVSACTGEITAPPASAPEGRTLDAAALKRLGAYGTTIGNAQSIVNRLLAARQRQLPGAARAHNDSVIAHIQTAIDGLRADSGALHQSLLNAAPRAPGARFSWAGSSSLGGFISGFTATTFMNSDPSAYPGFYIETAVTIPAVGLREVTTGSYVKQGQTTTFTHTAKVGDLDIGNPNQWISEEPDFPQLWPSLSDVQTILVDCTHVGVDANATTVHTAGYFPIDVGWTQITTTTNGTDNGLCPHVAPVAHMVYSGAGFSAPDPTELVIPDSTSTYDVMISLNANGTERDARITSYDWYVDGDYIGSTYYQSYEMTTSNIGISLTVTDSLGMTSTTDGSVVITHPSGNGGGGGGGGSVITVCYEAYLVYPDGSEIDLGQVCFTQYAT